MLNQARLVEESEHGARPQETSEDAKQNIIRDNLSQKSGEKYSPKSASRESSHSALSISDSPSKSDSKLEEKAESEFFTFITKIPEGFSAKELEEREQLKTRERFSKLEEEIKIKILEKIILEGKQECDLKSPLSSSSSFIVNSPSLDKIPLSSSFLTSPSLLSPREKLQKTFIRVKQDLKSPSFTSILDKSPSMTHESSMSSDTEEGLKFWQTTTPKSSNDPLLASFVKNYMGYSGKGERMRSHMVTSKGLDPCIYWEQKTGIGFCTINLDHQAIRKSYDATPKSLWDMYQNMILDNPDSLIKNYPFDKWFHHYIDALPENDVFKKYYTENAAKGAFTLIRFDKQQMNLCELKFFEGKVWVRKDHPNKPYLSPEIIDENQEWYPLDTTFLAKLPPEEAKKHLINDTGLGSIRIKEMKMIYVKNITTNKCYAVFDQPGKIYHSSLVKVSFDEYLMQKNNIYDGGTLTAENGILTYIGNDSGHIRPSETNFLTRGIMQDVIENSAHLHLKQLLVNSLVLSNNNPDHVFDKDNHTQLKKTNITGNKNILEFLAEKNLLNQETKKTASKSQSISPLSPSSASFSTPSSPSAREEKNPKRIAPPQDERLQPSEQTKISLFKSRLSFTKTAKVAEHGEIIKLIEKRHAELQKQKPTTKDGILIQEEKQFLQRIISLYYSNPSNIMLVKAATFAKKEINSDTFDLLTTPKKSTLWTKKSETHKILEKIDSLNEPGCSLLLR